MIHCSFTCSERINAPSGLSLVYQPLTPDFSNCNHACGHLLRLFAAVMVCDCEMARKRWPGQILALQSAGSCWSPREAAATGCAALQSLWRLWRARGALRYGGRPSGLPIPRVRHLLWTHQSKAWIKKHAVPFQHSFWTLGKRVLRHVLVLIDPSIFCISAVHICQAVHTLIAAF